VENLDMLYRRSRAVCCPLNAGSGTRIKILEAAAYGKPVVSTSIGAEGLDLRNGVELLIRNEPRAFAQACVLLLCESGENLRLGTAARAFVSEHYAKPKVVTLIRKHFHI